MASHVEQNPENRIEQRSARRRSVSGNTILVEKHDSNGTSDEDLPDIIDVVMAMGQQVQAVAEPEAVDGVALSPALPLAGSAPSGRLPAQLDALAERARAYVEAASSQNTRRAYAAEQVVWVEGRRSEWRSEKAYGYVEPGRTYYRGANYCREYTHTIYINGRPQTAVGTACRNPDGSWSPVG